MRLSINGWHPVASHLLCVITGVATASTLSQSHSSPVYAKEELSFTLAAETVMTNQEVTETPARISLLKAVNGRPVCRLFKSPLKVRASAGRLLFSTTLQDQIGLGHLTKELRAKTPIIGAEVSRVNEKLPICRSKPRISYGLTYGG